MSECGFCHRDPRQDGEAWTLHDYDSVKVHHKCLLYSTGIPSTNVSAKMQKDDFKLKDVQRELKRASNLTCCICKEESEGKTPGVGANAACGWKDCKKTFHVPCAAQDTEAMLCRYKIIIKGAGRKKTSSDVIYRIFCNDSHRKLFEEKDSKTLVGPPEVENTKPDENKEGSSQLEEGSKNDDEGADNDGGLDDSDMECVQDESEEDDADDGVIMSASNINIASDMNNDGEDKVSEERTITETDLKKNDVEENTKGDGIKQDKEGVEGGAQDEVSDEEEVVEEDDIDDSEAKRIIGVNEEKVQAGQEEQQKREDIVEEKEEDSTEKAAGGDDFIGGKCINDPEKKENIDIIKEKQVVEERKEGGNGVVEEEKQDSNNDLQLDEETNVEQENWAEEEEDDEDIENEDEDMNDDARVESKASTEIGTEQEKDGKDEEDVIDKQMEVDARIDPEAGVVSEEVEGEEQVEQNAASVMKEDVGMEVDRERSEVPREVHGEEQNAKDGLNEKQDKKLQIKENMDIDGDKGVSGGKDRNLCIDNDLSTQPTAEKEDNMRMDGEKEHVPTVNTDHDIEMKENEKVDEKDEHMPAANIDQDVEMKETEKDDENDEPVPAANTDRKNVTSGEDLKSEDGNSQASTFEKEDSLDKTGKEPLSEEDKAARRLAKKKRKQEAKDEHKCKIIPSIEEYFDDINKLLDYNTVFVLSLRHSDLADDILQEAMEDAAHFQICMSSDIKQDKNGYIELQFADRSTTLNHVRALSVRFGEQQVTNICPKSNQCVQVEEVVGPLTRMPDPVKMSPRMVAVADIPEAATPACIAEAISNAVNVYIPMSFISHSQKFYAYVEMQSEEDVDKLHNKMIQVGSKSCLVGRLESMPTPQEILDISVTMLQNMAYKSRYRKKRLPAAMQEEAERFAKYCDHYRWVDYLDETIVDRMRSLWGSYLPYCKIQEPEKGAKTKKNEVSAKPSEEKAKRTTEAPSGPKATGEQGSIDPTETRTKIFVGNLPRNLWMSNLKNICSKYGTVEGVHVVEPTRAKKAKCAFVQYATTEDAQNAIKALGEVVINGDKLNSGWAHNQEKIYARTRADSSNERSATSRERSPARESSKKSATSETRRKIYIGNVPRSMSVDDLRLMCEEYGPVTDVYSANPNYAFVEFLHAEDAIDAIAELVQIYRYGKYLIARYARDQVYKVESPSNANVEKQKHKKTGANIEKQKHTETEKKVDVVKKGSKKDEKQVKKVTETETKRDGSDAKQTEKRSQEEGVKRKGSPADEKEAVREKNKKVKCEKEVAVIKVKEEKEDAVVVKTEKKDEITVKEEPEKRDEITVKEEPMECRMRDEDEDGAIQDSDEDTEDTTKKLYTLRMPKSGDMTVPEIVDWCDAYGDVRRHRVVDEYVHVEFVNWQDAEDAFEQWLQRADEQDGSGKHCKLIDWEAPSRKKSVSKEESGAPKRYVLQIPIISKTGEEKLVSRILEDCRQIGKIKRQRLQDLHFRVDFRTWKDAEKAEQMFNKDGLCKLVKWSDPWPEIEEIKTDGGGKCVLQIPKDAKGVRPIDGSPSCTLSVEEILDTCKKHGKVRQHEASKKRFIRVVFGNEKDALQALVHWRTENIGKVGSSVKLIDLKVMEESLKADQAKQKKIEKELPVRADRTKSRPIEKEEDTNKNNSTTQIISSKRTVLQIPVDALNSKPIEGAPTCKLSSQEILNKCRVFGKLRRHGLSKRFIRVDFREEKDALKALKEWRELDIGEVGGHVKLVDWHDKGHLKHHSTKDAKATGGDNKRMTQKRCTIQIPMDLYGARWLNGEQGCTQSAEDVLTYCQGFGPVKQHALSQHFLHVEFEQETTAMAALKVWQDGDVGKVGDSVKLIMWSERDDTEKEMETGDGAYIAVSNLPPKLPESNLRGVMRKHGIEILEVRKLVNQPTGCVKVRNSEAAHKLAQYFRNSVKKSDGIHGHVHIWSGTQESLKKFTGESSSGSHGQSESRKRPGEVLQGGPAPKARAGHTSQYPTSHMPVGSSGWTAPQYGSGGEIAPAQNMGIGNMSMGQSNMGMGTYNMGMGMGQPNMGMPTPNMGMGQPNMGMPPHMGMGPNMSMPTPNMGMGQPMIGMSQPNMGMSQPNMVGMPTMGGPNMMPAQPNMAMGGVQPNMGMEGVQANTGAAGYSMPGANMGMGVMPGYAGMGAGSMGMGQTYPGMGGANMGMPNVPVGGNTMGMTAAPNMGMDMNYASMGQYGVGSAGTATSSMTSAATTTQASGGFAQNYSSYPALSGAQHSGERQQREVREVNTWL